MFRCGSDIVLGNVTYGCNSKSHADSGDADRGSFRLASRECRESEEPSPQSRVHAGDFCRAAQEKAVPRGDKSTYTDKQERKAQHIEQSYESRGVPEKEAERRAWAPSTRTMAAESGQADRAAASRLATPPRIKGAGLAALHRPRDRRRADRQRRKRLPLHASETPRTPPARTGNKHDRP